MFDIPNSPYIQIDQKKVAVKKEGFINNKLGVGYYKSVNQFFNDEWHAIDLMSGLSIVSTKYKKDIKAALVEKWDKLIEHRSSIEYQTSCRKFGAACKKAEKNQD